MNKAIISLLLGGLLLSSFYGCAKSEVTVEQSAAATASTDSFALGDMSIIYESELDPQKDKTKPDWIVVIKVTKLDPANKMIWYHTYSNRYMKVPEAYHLTNISDEKIKNAASPPKDPDEPNLFYDYAFTGTITYDRYQELQKKNLLIKQSHMAPTPDELARAEASAKQYNERWNHKDTESERMFQMGVDADLRDIKEKAAGKK